MARRRMLILIVFILVLGTFLAACSSSKDEPQASSPASSESAKPTATPSGPKEPVTLKVWYRLGGIYKEMLTSTIADFQKANPLITIEVNDIPAAQYAASMQAAIAGNSLPDFFLNEINIPLQKMVELDLLKDLNEIFPPKRMAEFIPGTFTEGVTTLKGKVYSVPTRDPRPAVPLVFYNKAMLAKAGYTEADLNKQLSYDQFIEMVKKTKEANNSKYGIAVSGRSDYWWFHLVYLNAMSSAVDPDIADGFNYKTGQYVYNNPGLVDAMKFFKKLDDEKLFLPNWLTMSNGETTQPFLDGKDAAFAFRHIESTSLYPSDTIGVMNIPTKDGKPFYVAFNETSDHFWQVNKKTKHPEEVTKFLEFFMADTYKKGLESAKLRSPVTALNATVKNESPMFNKLTPMIDKIYKIVPNPRIANDKLIDVYTESTAKKPSVTVENVFYGYLAGQIPDLQAALDKVNAETNKVWDAAIETVNKKNPPVAKKDFIFQSWKPFEDYKNK
ncbi:ABC transporter substrate-binding protein [Paenibacillus koleovorans]|uniref:ABC transporter substrate-binding protein n=1 Tax=Paenibacillus koleovorans TaxID=121608 RepID=UPI0013E34FD0|nr:extracellular solute-binding protein [Paenibacillus koleovorans]